MMPVDAIRIISLPHRTDRREAISADLNRAMEAGILPRIPWEFANRYPQGKTLAPGSWPHYASHWAVKREHEEVLGELWTSGSNLALILEDDAEFLPVFYEEAVSFYKEVSRNYPDWLAMFLGGHDVYGYEHRSARVLLNRGSTQSHAYLVNPPGICRLLDHLWCQPFQFVDWSYADLMRMDGCVYRPVHWLVTTREGWSDNRRELAKQGE